MPRTVPGGINAPEGKMICLQFSGNRINLCGDRISTGDLLIGIERVLPGYQGDGIRVGIYVNLVGIHDIVVPAHVVFVVVRVHNRPEVLVLEECGELL